MKAAFIEHTGPPEVIQYGEIQIPVISADQVLVKTEALAVNPVDTYIRAGSVKTNLPFPFVIGRDLVGTVIKTGERVTRFHEGDRVWTNNQGYDGRQGTFSAYCRIPEHLLYPLPPRIDPCRAVAVVHSALTAVIGLQFKAKLTKGETLFVNGGDGNIGNAVVRIAKALGARVAVTSSNEAKRSWIVGAGADLAIDYKKENVTELLRDFAPAGVDVYWDATRAPEAKQALDVVAHRGRIVFMAGANHETLLPSGRFYLQNCTLYGYTVTDANPGELSEYAMQINRWLKEGILCARIDRVLPLSQAAEAHRLVESGQLFGKIVLEPDGIGSSTEVCKHHAQVLGKDKTDEQCQAAA